MSEDTDEPTNNQHKSAIHLISHQNSHLAFRLHNLQTAQFTEKLKGPLRSLRQGSPLVPPSPPATVQEIRAQRKPSFTSLPHDPATTCTGTHWFTINFDDRRPCTKYAPQVSFRSLCPGYHHAYPRSILFRPTLARDSHCLHQTLLTSQPSQVHHLHSGKVLEV